MSGGFLVTVEFNDFVNAQIRDVAYTKIEA